MLSKEQKMKYGQLLRQQIKQKEQTKKAHKRQHTPFQEPSVIPQPHLQLKFVQQQQPQINLDRYKSDRQAQKQLLAKKMQEQAYNPFGKFGSGAPNKIINVNKAEYNNSRDQGQQIINENVKVYPHQQNPYQNQGQGYKRIPTPQFLQGAYNNVPFVHPQFASPAPYGYINVNDNEINYVGKIDLPRPPPNLELNYEYQQPYKNPQMPYGIEQERRQQKRENQETYRPQQYQDNNKMQEIERDIFKKGGRNLLKFQNQTPEHIMNKQNEKLRLQQELKKQMQEAARRKKEEEQRIKQQDERLQKKNREFLQLQKKRYEQQLNNKKGQTKNVEQANAKQQPTNLKKQKFQKIREEVAKREQQERRQLDQKDKLKEKQKEKQNAYLNNPYIQKNIKKNNDMDQVESAISNQTQMSRGFNTAISKQFFKKQREKNGFQKMRVDKITQQMEKMRRQIAHQGHYYHKQVQKFQKQTEKAKQQKEKADEEIARLKKQLRQKMDYNNKKFLQEIYKGKVQMKDPYYADEVQLQQNAMNSLKQRKEQKLVLKEYKPQEYKQYEPENNKMMSNDSDMISLIGDSKKIPMGIQSNQSLTISKLDNFAKDTQYFKSINKKNQPPLPKKYIEPESIIEQDQRREESRQSNRTRHKRSEPKEELDMLMESRKKSRGGWGQMSSVNEQMVNEIENMLQPKQRPKSHLSNIGQQSLSQYQNDAKLNNDRKRQSTSASKMQKQSSGTINSLDKLIRKYL